MQNLSTPCCEKQNSFNRTIPTHDNFVLFVFLPSRLMRDSNHCAVWITLYAHVLFAHLMKKCALHPKHVIVALQPTLMYSLPFSENRVNATEHSSTQRMDTERNRNMTRCELSVEMSKTASCKKSFMTFVLRYRGHKSPTSLSVHPYDIRISHCISNIVFSFLTALQQYSFLTLSIPRISRRKAAFPKKYMRESGYRYRGNVHRRKKTTFCRVYHLVLFPSCYRLKATSSDLGCSRQPKTNGTLAGKGNPSNFL